MGQTIKQELKTIGLIGTVVLALLSIAAFSPKPYIDVQDYGADPTGTYDSTSQINSAIAAACPSGLCSNSIFVPPGIYKVSQVNATNLLYFHMQARASSGGYGPGSHGPIVQFDCEENSNNSGVCMDFTGDQYNTLDGIEFITLTSGHAPKTLVLLSKSTAANGNSQSFDWHNDSFIQNGGSYSIYDAGGEIFTCRHCNVNGINSSPTVAGLFISANNTPAMTSPFATVQSAPISMTGFSWVDGSSLSSSSGPPLMFDEGANYGVIDTIAITGFCNSPSGTPCMTDYSAADSGSITGLSIRDFRDESTGTPAPLINLVHTGLFSSHISNVTYASASNLSGAAFTFFNIGSSFIQADYTTIVPTYGVSCSNGGGGLVVINPLDGSGHVVPNNCIGGSTQFVPNGGVSSQFESMFAWTPSGTSCSNTTTGFNTETCATNSTACTNGTPFATGGSTHCRLYCNGTAWVETGAGC